MEKQKDGEFLSPALEHDENIFETMFLPLRELRHHHFATIRWLRAFECYIYRTGNSTFFMLVRVIA